jgi:hypothetical protein
VINSKDISLPEGWKWKRLGQIASVISGQSPPGDTYRKTQEGLPFFQGKADFGQRYPVATSWCIEPKKIAHQGDILISVRAPVGPTNVTATPLSRDTFKIQRVTNDSLTGFPWQRKLTHLVNQPFKKVRKLGIEKALGSGGVIAPLFPIVMDDSPCL